MNSIGQLKKFVFNGFLLDDTLNRLETEGISVKGNERISPILRIDETQFSPIIVHNANRMSSVYRRHSISVMNNNRAKLSFINSQYWADSFVSLY